MRIGQWTETVPALAPLPRPNPGWRPPLRSPRASVEQALGGVVAHLNAGYPSDDAMTLRWDTMLSGPSIAVVTTLPDASAALPNLLTGERLAAPVKPGAFAAVGAARLWLRRVGAVTGYVTIDIWDDAVGVPSQKLGTIGYLDAASIADVWTTYERASEAAWPIDAAMGGHIVLSAVAMAGAGRIEWGATAAGAGHYKYTGGVWGAVANQDLSVTTWQGAPFAVLRGLAAAGNYHGGPGPFVYEMDFDDGQLYTGIVLEVEDEHQVQPTPWGGSIVTPPMSAGVARAVSATFGIYSELAG